MKYPSTLTLKSWFQDNPKYKKAKKNFLYDNSILITEKDKINKIPQRKNKKD